MHLSEYLKKSNEQIEEIVELVRGELSQMTRISLGALIVMDVHGMVFCFNLISTKNATSFVVKSSTLTDCPRSSKPNPPDCFMVSIR